MISDVNPFYRYMSKDADSTRVSIEMVDGALNEIACFYDRFSWEASQDWKVLISSNQFKQLQNDIIEKFAGYIDERARIESFPNGEYNGTIDFIDFDKNDDYLRLPSGLRVYKTPGLHNEMYLVERSPRPNAHPPCVSQVFNLAVDEDCE